MFTGIVAIQKTLIIDLRFIQSISLKFKDIIKDLNVNLFYFSLLISLVSLLLGS